MLRRSLSVVPLGLALLVFLLLGSHQLDLPGLHYDEAKEAGLNAMQLLTGQPVTAFRDATVSLGPWRLPLMVQDYIGNLNVLLAVPFLALGGVNVVALRWLPLLIGAGTLALAWAVARRLAGPLAAAVTALLLAVNPSFVFWSRQGIFVTNLTALLFMASLLTGLLWWSTGRRRWLWLTAFLWGLGIYAKLLFVWAIGAMGVVAVVLLAWQRLIGVGPLAGQGVSKRRQPNRLKPRLRLAVRDWPTWLSAAACFLLPLIPLILFNIRTGGTLASIFGNLGRSYYGVDNSAYLPNLAARAGQVVTLLRGDQFWYLGAAHANEWAVWLAAGVGVVGVVGWLWRTVGPDRPEIHAWTSKPRPLNGARLPVFLLPLALLALAVAQSAFTVSDLFVTHYALLLPLIPLAAGLAVEATGNGRRTKDEGRMTDDGRRRTVDEEQNARGASASRRLSSVSRPSSFVSRPSFVVRLLSLVLTLALCAAWLVTDLQNTLAYHRVLTLSGGVGAHSDAINKLADYLDSAPYHAPIALDWGLDAPVRFLTGGRVTPVEVFGYARMDATDEGFPDRVAPYLTDADNVYLAHGPGKAVFQGRVEALEAATAAQDWQLLQQAWFTERSGNVLYIVYRAIP